MTPGHAGDRKTDRACILVILVATLAVYAPALFGGRVLLPADIVPLMPPWAASAREKFPDYRFAQNQLHGPIFEYYSWRHYARERMRAGEVPLWNPYELSGNVLLGNSQSAVLYPPNLLLYLLPLWLGINVVTALHTFLTGLFMYALMRSLRLRPPAALTGALVWMFCGLMTVWTEFQTPTAVLCWLPACLWCWERSRTHGWRWAVFGSGSAVALTLLAGHLHFAFYVLLAFGLWTVFRSSGVQVFGRVALLAAALGFGVMLSLATMLPVLEIGRLNFRATKPEYATAVALKLPPENLLTLVLPNLLGNPRDYVVIDANGQAIPGHGYWGKFDFIEYCGYVGIPALILALVGVAALLRKRSADEEAGGLDPLPDRAPGRIFAALALIGLLLALGTPLCALFFYGVPGYKQFNATARALCLFSFGLSALVAYGVSALWDGANRRSVGRALALSAVVVVLLALVAWPGVSIYATSQGDEWLPWKRLLRDEWTSYQLTGLLRALAFAAATGVAGAALLGALKLNPAARRAAAWALPAVAALDLLLFGAGFNPVTNPEMLGYPTRVTDVLGPVMPARSLSLEQPGGGIKSFIVPNYNAVVHLREVQGADSLHTMAYHRLMGAAVRAMDPSRTVAFPDPNTIHVPSADHPLLDMLNVRYVTSMVPLDAARFRRVEDAEMSIWENPRAYGEAWMVGAAEPAGSIESTVARLGAPGFDGHHTALLSSEAGRLDPAASGSPVTVTRFSAHRIDLRVSARADGLLVLSEPVYPGWQATVDGRVVRILTANGLLRAVHVPAGEHSVLFEYRPASWRTGLYLSVVACGVMVASLTYRGRRRVPT